MSDALQPSNTAQLFLIFGRFGQKMALLSFVRNANRVRVCANVSRTMARTVRSNSVNWEGGSITFE